jgi:hypothetical protein
MRRRFLRAHCRILMLACPLHQAPQRLPATAKTPLTRDRAWRAFLGWLRGEKRHCSMVAIPTVEEEDARRPNRERGNLVTEQTRIVNQIKTILVRFGIRTFRPRLRKAEEKLEGLRTAEWAPLLENTRAELRRYLARLRVVREQIPCHFAARSSDWVFGDPVPCNELRKVAGWKSNQSCDPSHYFRASAPVLLENFVRVPRKSLATQSTRKRPNRGPHGTSDSGHFRGIEVHGQVEGTLLQAAT